MNGNQIQIYHEIPSISHFKNWKWKYGNVSQVQVLDVAFLLTVKERTDYAAGI